MTMELTEVEKSYYFQCFQYADQDKDGFVNGYEAVNFLTKSGINNTKLATIWELVNADKKNKLNKNSFYTALRLVALVQMGRECSLSQINKTTDWIIPKFNGVPLPSPAPAPKENTMTALSLSSQEEYSKLFKNLDPEGSGKINALISRELFMKSGLNNSDLAKIWTLSDMNKDGSLSRVEFITAMHLINLKRLHNINPPDVLPESLLHTISANDAMMSKGTQHVPSTTSASQTKPPLPSLSPSPSPSSSAPIQNASTPQVSAVQSPPITKLDKLYADKEFVSEFRELVDHVSTTTTTTTTTTTHGVPNSSKSLPTTPAKPVITEKNVPKTEKKKKSDSVMEEIVDDVSRLEFYSTVIDNSKSLIANTNRITNILNDVFDAKAEEQVDKLDELSSILNSIEFIADTLHSFLHLQNTNIKENVMKTLSTRSNIVLHSTKQLINHSRSMVENPTKIQTFKNMPVTQRLYQVKQLILAITYAVKQLIQEMDVHKLSIFIEKESKDESETESEDAEHSASNSEPSTPREDIFSVPAELENNLDVVEVTKESPKVVVDFKSIPFTPNRSLSDYDVKGAEVLQRLWRRMYQRSRWRNLVREYTNSPASRNSRTRVNVLFEFLTTEERYVNGLATVINYWLKPLREKSLTKVPLCTPLQIVSLFGSIEIIYNFNVELKTYFQKRLQEFPVVNTFGDILLQMAPIMRLYVDYVNNYDNSLETHKTLLKNKDFVEFDKEVKDKANLGLDLPSLLITPAQRLPRYELLLRVLILNFLISG
eukprot:TRINITY_DN1197_c0_g1_i4.p1 TRINITY_DN1197_c0_g1~~TRINITY_DN1197_c0_g1_i4.p1  ORF type:complete len:770 (+),score=158.69 TRINITY_DN1197_c0_g1_i4:4-2313(+)